MKALVYEGPNTMVLREIDVPVVNDDEVLIEVAVSGICGSELSGYLGRNSLRKPPLIFGHEFSGVIASVGAGVTQFKQGDRVTANPLVTCGTCSNCRNGRQQLCPSRKLLSAALPGSNAEYVKIPWQNVYPLSDELTFTQGALAEPLACAVHAVELGTIQTDDTVLVVGMGPIGQLILQVLLSRGITRVLVADMNTYRLEQARAIGAIGINPKEQDLLEEIRRATDGHGVEVAMDAVGATLTRQNCVDATAMGGTVVFTGLHAAESNLPINDMIRREIKTVGAFAYNTKNFEQAIQLLADGQAGFHDGVVKAPLQDGDKWFRALIENTSDVTKVLLDPKQ